VLVTGSRRELRFDPRFLLITANKANLDDVDAFGRATHIVDLTPVINAGLEYVTFPGAVRVLRARSRLLRICQ